MSSLMEKMTYAAALSNAIDILSGTAGMEQTVSRLTDLYTSLEKRAAHKTATPSKASREAAEFANTVFHVLNESGTAMTCGAIAKELDVSTQKVSAALTKLGKAGLIDKHTEKGVSIFSVAGPDEDCDVDSFPRPTDSI